MIARNRLPAEWVEWNAVTGAPHFGTFGQQVWAPTTRVWELPWAHHALGLSPGATLLDIGGGLSGFGPACSREGVAVTIVDPFADNPSGPRLLARWCDQWSARATVVRATVGGAELADESFDAVCCLSVLEHVASPEERRRIMREAWRVLRPGGRFALTVDLCLGLAPFTSILVRGDLRNVDVHDLLEAAPFTPLVGDPHELFGSEAFDAARIAELASSGSLLVAAGGIMTQCVLLEKAQQGLDDALNHIESDLPSIEDPVFIVGSSRSGTTLLRMMLTAHPDLAIPPEGAFLSPFLASMAECDGLFSPYLPPVGIHAGLLADAWGCDEKCGAWNVNPRLLLDVEPSTWGELGSRMHRAWARRIFPEARRWGDKNPIYVRAVDGILRAFPRAKILHLVRDPRSVVASLREVSFGSDVTEEAANQWVEDVHAGRAAARSHPTDVLEVRYEDLVRNPELELRRIAAFVGLPYTDAMLEYARLAEDPDVLPVGQRQWHRRCSLAVDPTRTDRWRAVLSQQAVAVVEGLATELLHHYGYA